MSPGLCFVTHWQCGHRGILKGPAKSRGMLYLAIKARQLSQSLQPSDVGISVPHTDVPAVIIAGLVKAVRVGESENPVKRLTERKAGGLVTAAWICAVTPANCGHEKKAGCI
jgi:hypothetical protein